MRLLYVDHTAKIGGGEIALANLVHQLNRDIVEPAVVLFEEGPLQERLAAITTVYLLPLSPNVADTKKDTLGWRSLFRLRPIFLTLRQVFKVAQLAKELKTDIIHTNSLKADIIGGLAGRIARIPVVWHIRDRIDQDYLSKPVVLVFRWLSRLIPSFVIANSEATLATVCLDGRRPSIAIGSGVDISQYTEASLSSQWNSGHLHNNEQRAKIGLVGRISPWKGQHIFLQAAAEVLKRHPTAQFELIGAALFDEQAYEKDLHSLCKSLDIEHAVTFVGFVKDVPSRVLQLDILVHASTTGEPYGQVIIEGMAAEKPVVATNGGGVPEIVLDGITGILVPMGDPLAMANAVDYLLENPSIGRSMGQAGRRRAMEQFTVQRTARMVEDVYLQIRDR